MSSSRDSSNSAPKWPSPGPSASCSQHRFCARSTYTRLDTASDGAGTTAYLLGLAPDAIVTAADLSAGRRSSHREVCAQRPRAPARALYGL